MAVLLRRRFLLAVLVRSQEWNLEGSSPGYRMCRADSLRSELAGPFLVRQSCRKEDSSPRGLKEKITYSMEETQTFTNISRKLIVFRQCINQNTLIVPLVDLACLNTGWSLFEHGESSSTFTRIAVFDKACKLNVFSIYFLLSTISTAEQETAR